MLPPRRQDTGYWGAAPKRSGIPIAMMGRLKIARNSNSALPQIKEFSIKLSTCERNGIMSIKAKFNGSRTFIERELYDN